MPVRIRKTFKIFPGVRVNLSKGGASFTVGAKGYHLNFSKRGVRQTVGLPGSGISETSYIVKNDPDSESKKRATPTKHDDDSEEAASEEHKESTDEPRARRSTPLWLLLVGIVVVYFGALFLGLIPSDFLSQALHTLTEWTKGFGL